VKTPATAAKAGFIEPMLLLATTTLPEGPNWLYEVKLDGFRAIAFKSNGRVYLRSRNNNDFASRYKQVTMGLESLPDETVIDGEIVALDASGRPSFNLLQNLASAAAPVVFYVFDVMIVAGRNVMKEPLDFRRELLRRKILPNLQEPIRYLPELRAALADVVQAIRAQGLEGIVAKRRDSRYEARQRSGAWRKMRINQGQDFVIAGYTPSSTSFDAVVFGYYDGDRLIYAARTRNGFTPSSRAALFKRFPALHTSDCPFANLPEARSGRWGQGLTADKMKECRWLKPILVARFEFVEWTTDDHLRHSRFVALREGKNPADVHREALPQ
jgi:bifunctional non-homologous end joining protein LigD